MNKPDRRSFAFEFKLGVVARYVGGEATALELARDHGLRPRRKGRPPAAAAERSGPGELERLRRRTCGCRRRWPAWKIAGLEGSGARVKTQAVAALKVDYSLLVVAGLARSTFFYHQARLGRPDPHAGLKTAVAEAFEAARGRYGHRRIHAVLVRDGWQIAKKTVLKVMNALGLVCKIRRPRRRRSWPA